MALKLADRVVELSTSTGTGAFTLSGAQAGYQAFSSRLSNGDTTYYTIQGKNGDGSLNNEWEVGVGTYSSSTLTRDTVLDSSNSGSLVNFSAGNKDVFIDLPSEKVITTAGTGISISGNTITNTLPDQIVSLTGAGTTTVTGTYPSFTITSTGGSGGGDVTGPASSTDNAITRFDGTTGKLIQNSVVTISDTGGIAGATTITDINYIDFNTGYTTALGAGQLGWDGNNTLGLGMSGGNIIQEIGLQTYIYGKASSAITKGQLIKKTGANGSSGVVTFAPTTANMTNSGDIIGIAAENIALNGFGYIISTGNIKGFNTTGSSSGETWADGDTLYYNPTGNGLMTKVKPSAPNVKAEVAIVTNAGSGGSGSVVVEIIHGSELGGTDSNVQFTSPTTGQSLVYNSSTGIWVNGNNQVINGGTIDNTPIGATTASTGRFTSVTTPSVTATTNDLTLSAISTGVVNVNTLAGKAFSVTDHPYTGGGSNVNFTRAFGGQAGYTTGLMAQGSDSNVTLAFSSKGTSGIEFWTANLGERQFVVSRTASAVNYIQVSGGATGQSSLALRPRIQVQGSDASVGLTIDTKGSGAVDFTTNSNNATSFRVFLQDSPVNYFQVRGSSTNIEPVMSVLGTDTNISLGLQSKGTGAIDLAAGSDGVNISNGGTVTAITRTAGGSGYTSKPTLTISAPTTAGGVQAVATVDWMTNNGATIGSGGTGYAVGNVLTVVGGTPFGGGAATLTVSAVSSGVVTAVTATNFGSYSTLPTNPVSTTGGAGTGCTLNLIYNMGTTFTFSNAGSGYIEQPTVTFSGGGGSGAGAYARVGGQSIIRSIGSPLSLHTPNGEGFRVQDSGTLSTAFWTAFGTSATPILRAISGSAGAIQTESAVPLQFLTNSNFEQLRVAHTASAVNYVQISGQTTGNFPNIAPQGSDANIGFDIFSKGTSPIRARTGGGEQLRIADRASANRYIQIQGGVSGATAPSIGTAGGTEALDFYASGGFPIWFSTNGLRTQTQFAVSHTASAVNYVQVTGAATGSAPIISAQGSNANVGLTISTKGTGTLALNGTNIQTTGSLTQTGSATFLSDIFSIYDSSGSNEAVRSTYNSGNSTFAVDFRAGTRVTAPIFESTTQFTFVTIPTNNNTSVTITADNIVNGILTGTPAANINYTLPTGTNMDAQFGTGVNGTAEWSIINLAGATFSITVLGNTGHTLVGNMVVAANSSARFASRKTATNTYVTYRLS